METIHLICKKLNGENRCFTEVGNNTVTLLADVPVGLYLYERKRFIISYVGYTDKFLNARYYAEKYLEYCYCGDIHNVEEVALCQNII